MPPLASLYQWCHLTALPPNRPNPNKASSLLKTKESLHQWEVSLFKGDTWS